MNKGLYVELGMQIVRHSCKGDVFIADNNTVCVPKDGLDVTRICIISTEDDGYVTINSGCMNHADFLAVYLIAAEFPFVARRVMFTVPHVIPDINKRFNFRCEAALITFMSRHGFRPAGVSLV